MRLRVWSVWLLLLTFALSALAGPPPRPKASPKKAPAKVEREHKDEKKEEERAEKGPTGPDLAMRWRMLAWRDENGQIDPLGLKRAQTQIAQLAQDRRFDVPTYRWTELGPDNIPGRSRTLDIDPRNPSILLNASVGGGIWRSSDQGQTWSPVNDRLPNLAVTCIARDRNAPDTLYATTGEGYFNGDAIRGGGILRSRDNGLTWTLMANSEVMPYLNKVAVSPTNSNVLLVSGRNGGVYRSADAGATWTQVVPAQMGQGITWHPTDGNQVLATVMDYDFNRGTWFSAAFRSNDAGQTWTQATGATRDGFNCRIELAYAPSSPNVVYGNIAPGNVLKSTDGGSSFVQVNTSGSTSASWYNNSLWVHPTDPNFIVFTGLHTYKSTNGGVTVTAISNGYIWTDQVHPDNHFVVADPGFDGVSNKRLYVATDGGLHVTEDVTTANTQLGWIKLVGPRTTQYYGAVGDGRTGVIVGGTQDNGSQILFQDSNEGFFTYGGDGGWNALDWNNNQNLYGEYVYAQIFRSRDGGQSTESIYGPVSDGGANFIAPFILDPNDSKRLLAGAGQLWRTNDATAASVSWSAIKAWTGQPISAIAVAPGNANVIFVGHNDGTVYRTVNGLATNPTWTVVDDNGATNPFPDRYIGRIAFDPQNASRIFVGTGGFNSGNLWLSTNGGSSWSNRSGTGATKLAPAPIRGIAVHPTNPNRVYVGTEVGLCQSADGGLNWSAPSEGPLNVSVDEVTFMYGTDLLLLATHGRGLWLLGPVNLTSLSGPEQLVAGETGTYTLTVDRPAGPDGLTVALSAEASLLAVPASVTIPPRARSTSFPATAATGPGTATLTATLDGASRTLQVGVGPLALTGLNVAPDRIIGGQNSTVTGTVTLNSPAPQGGVVVTLTSGRPDIVTVPATLTVPAGAKTQTFTVGSVRIATRQDVAIRATYNGVTLRKAIVVNPPAPTRVLVEPYAFVGGSDTTVVGTLTISHPAPIGLRVQLLSFDPLVTVPAEIAFTEGATTATFPVNHASRSGSKVVTLKAISGSYEKYGTMRVRPPSVALSLGATSVKGGTAVTGTLTLNAPAPAGGAMVYLYRSPSNAATLPATVTIPAGSRTATFTVATRPVSANTTLSVIAKYSNKVTVTLTVTP